jgi:L-threonylcarbamoyladenylate synthase
MDASSNPQKTTRIEPYGKAAIVDAAALILSDCAVGVPTETVYGLAADSTNAAGVAAIYAAKGRPDFNPLIVHVADVTMAQTLVEWDSMAEALADAFWPGPLTFVLPKHADCPVSAAVSAGLSTLAVRCPAHPAMHDLIAAVGRPLAAPSANRSGSISPTTAAHVAASLGGLIPMIIDGGPCEQGLESTIIRCSAEHIIILRPGFITSDMLAAASGLPVVFADSNAAISAPGMIASHYAPQKPVSLNVTMPDADHFHIGFGAHAGDINLSPSGDVAQAASQLFAALHRADASAKPRISVAPIDRADIGIALNDRLQRAAAPKP